MPYAEQIDWVVKPGSRACDGSAGAAWWPGGDWITFAGGRLLTEHASDQICISRDFAHVHDAALHEAAHWWESHVIGVTRIYADFGANFPVYSSADYVRFSQKILEQLADCAALSWGASWVNYGCPPGLAHAYGL